MEVNVNFERRAHAQHIFSNSSFIPGVLFFIPEDESEMIFIAHINLTSFKAVVLLLLTFCLLLLPLRESVIVLCFVVRYFMSFLVLQSS